jgi:hypothetical protein
MVYALGPVSSGRRAHTRWQLGIRKMEAQDMKILSSFFFAVKRIGRMSVIHRLPFPAQSARTDLATSTWRSLQATEQPQNQND